MTDVIEIYINGVKYKDGENDAFENIEVGEIIDDIVFYNKREVGDVITIKVVG
jgi:hypothetical protein